jgi:chlorite dismutase
MLFLRNDYLLHDDRGIVYVGRANKGDGSIIKRLKSHTTDRLAGKWQKFSWFGFYPIDKNNKTAYT